MENKVNKYDPENLLQSSFPLIEETLKYYQQTNKVPGLGIGMVYEGQQLWFKGLGVKNLETQEPIDNNTLFRAASITKQFTCLMMLKLRDQGKLKLDDQLEQYIKEAQDILPYQQFQQDNENSQENQQQSDKITLRQLASNSSGLPENGDFDRWEGDEMQDKQTVYESLKYTQALFPPNKQFRYSALGYILLGYALEKASGENYKDYIEKNILSPLDMQNSGLEYNLDKNKDKEATGYKPSMNKEIKIEQAPKVGYGDCLSCGGLLTSIEDMCKYLIYQLQDGKNLQETMKINQESLHQMKNPVIMMEPEKRFQSYGLGLFIREFQGYRVIEHSGSTWGFLSNMLLIPELNFGYVLWYNYTGGKFFTQLNDDILKIIVPVLQKIKKQKDKKLQNLPRDKKKYPRQVFVHKMGDQRRITIPQLDLQAIQLDYKDLDGFSKKGVQADRIKEKIEIIQRMETKYGQKIEGFLIQGGAQKQEILYVFYDKEEGSKIDKIKISGQFFYPKQQEPFDKFQ